MKKNFILATIDCPLPHPHVKAQFALPALGYLPLTVQTP